MPRNKLDEKLLKSRSWIIDGANGSEIQRLSDEADGDFGAMAALEKAEIVVKVHKSYVLAGANFLISNTYSSNYNILASKNNESACPDLIKEAIKLTNEAIRGEKDRFVCASISEHPPFDDKMKLCLM